MEPSSKAVHPLGQPLLAIVGPTASGKSDVAQQVACKMGRCVLGADSMQVYRGMDIGTGKLAPQHQVVAHYGIDIADPSQPYSAAQYQKYGRRVVEGIDAHGSSCVVCGGTGFYIRALVDDYVFPAGEQVGNAVRDHYNEMARQHGPQSVWNELARIDRESAELIPVNDVKRVVRALELLDEGTSYATQKRALASIEAYYPTVFVGLGVDPSLLAERIDRRVDEMFAEGFADEVERLVSQGLAQALTARHAIGYEQVISCLQGSCTLDEAITQMKTATHRLAKRQRTWFRGDKRVVWIDADDLPTAGVEAVAQRVLEAACCNGMEA